MVATLVNGVSGCENHGDTVDNMYLMLKVQLLSKGWYAAKKVIERLAFDMDVGI